MADTYHLCFSQYRYPDYRDLWNALDLDIRLLPFDAFKKESRHISI